MYLSGYKCHCKFCRVTVEVTVARQRQKNDKIPTKRPANSIFAGLQHTDNLFFQIISDNAYFAVKHNTELILDCVLYMFD